MKKRLKVIMVDSSNTAQNKAVRYTKDKKMDIVARAGNETEAIDLFLKYRPDLVILDISIPGVDPIKCIERLKSIDESVNILLVSPYLDEETCLAGIAQGAMGFLRKPFTTETLFHALTATPEYEQRYSA